MKKIGIITLFGNINYGNRLQNYAVHTILSRRGFQVETIVFERNRWKPILYPAFNWTKRILKKDPMAYRIYHFQLFNRTHIPFRTIFHKAYRLPRGFSEEYDYFVTGSDQVWNITASYEEGYKSILLLEFANDVQKICISPSIGVPAFDENDSIRMRKALSGYKYICCREKQGAQELARITGRTCEWLIDPTLYLTAEDWKQLLNIHQDMSGSYLFIFFLDGISLELRSFIHDFAQRRGLQILDPSDPVSPFFSVDPGEFIKLLASSEIVFTDSFHVTVFSINFHIPFYVFDRNKMKNRSSRIESICECLDLSNRFIREQQPFEIKETCNFEAAETELLLQRNLFSAYLDKCFEV